MDCRVSSEDSIGESIEDFWKEQQDLNCLFDYLKFLEVGSIIGGEIEIRFIEFLLANAPILQRVCIENAAETNDEILVETEEVKRLKITACFH